MLPLKLPENKRGLSPIIIAKTERGFDFLGYHFGPKGLSIASKTLDNFVERAIWLYEQEPGVRYDSTRLVEYAKRWVRQAGAGLGNGNLLDRG